MGITCCNDTQELFLEIDECKNIEKIEYVIRSKAKDILIEIKEIIDYINDSKKIPKVIKVENIQKEYLEKRIEHIKEIQHCFIEAADLMSKKNYVRLIIYNDNNYYCRLAECNCCEGVYEGDYRFICLYL